MTLNDLLQHKSLKIINTRDVQIQVYLFVLGLLKRELERESGVRRRLVFMRQVGVREEHIPNRLSCSRERAYLP
ncbi:hypothetical protein H5410_061601 [Solanum commersonii]|uniref:Uncharacterized protein n=1 Tax=Solanum commersonii TaxID=4109 RepID=A0A9J5W864_SOLCO|nr:hypothetical protein H5410_061601 [Solanum commersonii]